MDGATPTGGVVRGRRGGSVGARHQETKDGNGGIQAESRGSPVIQSERELQSRQAVLEQCPCGEAQRTAAGESVSRKMRLSPPHRLTATRSRFADKIGRASRNATSVRAQRKPPRPPAKEESCRSQPMPWGQQLVQGHVLLGDLDAVRLGVGAPRLHEGDLDGRISFSLLSRLCFPFLREETHFLLDLYDCRLLPGETTSVTLAILSFHIVLWTTILFVASSCTCNPASADLHASAIGVARTLMHASL